MNTALIAPCIIRNDHDLVRNIKWIDYYKQIKGELGIKDIWLVDNASEEDMLMSLPGTFEIFSPKFKWRLVTEGGDTNVSFKMLHYEQRYERTAFKRYHYYWRALFSALQTIRRYGDYDKILFIDTDMFVLTKELANHVRDIHTGWNAFWCPRHNFADSTFQVLCKDAFHLVDQFIADSFPIEKYDDMDAEHILPFTNVIKHFKGDRYGELALAQTPDMMYYGQANIDFKPIWEMK